MSGDFILIKGKRFIVGDRVRYRPNHVSPIDDKHRDIEYGRITSIRDNAVWVRYEKQHPSQPGQRTPTENLEDCP